MLGWLYRVGDTLRDRRRRQAWDPDQAAGRRGEDLAHRFLQQQGMVVVARNYRTRSGSGELDLVAWDGETLVFVEVKTRATEEFGSPDRAVDDAKRDRLMRAAREYVRRAGADWRRVRFDIVNVVLRPRPAITLLRDVFPIRPAV
jgi:putative endonuclease